MTRGANRKERVRELMVRWEDFRERGETLSPEELCANDPDLADDVARQMRTLRQLDSMLGASDAADDTLVGRHTLPEDEWTPDWQPLAITLDYTLQRAHARGGRGEIYVAKDSLFDRRVAIKRIPAELDYDHRLKERLIREARIIGQLQHPGILPIYGYGRDAQERPFYCMRFVDGKTLRAAIDEFQQQSIQLSESNRRLKFVELVRFLISVCQTVAYAHSKDVVHRDIKPENVMLGEFGATFLVDWGLAKRVGAADDDLSTGSTEPVDPIVSKDVRLTRPGMAFGTPAYMSPESARGQHDLDPRGSDIFSLGAILYTILTGRAPYDGRHIAEVIEKARTTQFVVPQNVDRALASICVKAMAPLPNDRYETSQKMARDLERWLADEPISCHRETITKRALRFARRHRVLTSSALLLMVGSLVVLSIGSWLINAEKARADENFRRSRQAVYDSFVRVSENELLEVPGLRPLRKDLLAASLAYYDELISDSENDDQLQQEQADILYRVGSLDREAEDTKSANSKLSRALDLYQRLDARSSDEDRINMAIADCLHELAKVHLQNGDRNGMQRYYAESLALLATQTDQPTASRSLLARLAATHLALAENSNLEDGIESAEHHLAQAEAIVERIAADLPKSSRVLQLQSQCQMRHGFLQARAGHLDDALLSYQKAQDFALGAINESPQELRNRKTHARICETAGELLHDNRRYDEASQWFGIAADQYRHLFQRFPSVVDFREQWSKLIEARADTELKAERLPNSLRDFQQALQMREFLNQDTNELKKLLAQLHFDMGQWHRQEGRVIEAADSYQQAKTIHVELGANVDVNNSVALGQSFLLIGLSQWEAGEHHKGLASFQSARELFADMIEIDSATLAYRGLLAAAYMGEAMSLTMLEEPSKAETVIRRGIDQLLHLRDQGDDTSNTRIGLNTSYFLLAGVLARTDQEAAAKIADDRCREFLPIEVEDLLQLARNYASNGAKFGRGKNEFSASDRFHFERYREQAITCLQVAMDRGFEDFDRLANDPAFVSLFTDQRFRDWIMRPGEVRPNDPPTAVGPTANDV